MTTSPETETATDALLQALNDIEIINRKSYLRSLLELCYAQQLIPLIKDLASNDCTGCLIDHPSQEEHDRCIMMEFCDKVDMYLDSALDLLNENVVICKWFEYLVRLEPPVRYHEISPYLDTEWRWDVWMDDAWKTDMTMMLLELDEDPQRFDHLKPT